MKTENKYSQKVPEPFDPITLIPQVESALATQVRLM